VLPHLGVHRRSDDDLFPGPEVPSPGHRRQEVGARTVGQTGQRVGVEGSDHENVAPQVIKPHLTTASDVTKVVTAVGYARKVLTAVRYAGRGI